MHGIQCDKVEFQNCTSLVKYKYILVYTGTYWYILPKHSKLHLITLHPPSGAYESQQNAWLGPFSQFSSAWRSPPQSDHPGEAFHCQSSASRTQVALEEELGACIPTVFKGNIVYVFCNAVRIWRDHDDGILHTPQTVRNGITL